MASVTNRGGKFKWVLGYKVGSLGGGGGKQRKMLKGKRYHGIVNNKTLRLTDTEGHWRARKKKESSGGKRRNGVEGEPGGKKGVPKKKSNRTFRKPVPRTSAIAWRKEPVRRHLKE